MKKVVLGLMCVLASAVSANAQFYEIANQIPQLISPALSGSFNYRGFVDASYLKGLGDYNSDFVEVSTSQGFQYASWFFMGVGIGVDGVFTHPKDGWGSNQSLNWPSHGHTDSAVMVPIFTDFRFRVGKDPQSVSFFGDVRLGAAFLMGNNWLRIGNGYLTNNEYFYLRPTAGVRIPISEKNPRQAVNVGLSYQLITSNYWYGNKRNVAISALGVTAGFEW